MAGDWIKMTHALPEKPEVLAIAGKTGLTRFDVVGRLFTLWRWFDNNTTDGNAVGVTLVTLEECLFGYSVNVGFVPAVVAVGWLEATDTGVRVVKFDAHISQSAKTRAQTNKRVAKSKAGARAANAQGNADSVTPAVTPGVAKTVPREEKTSPSLRSGEVARPDEIAPELWADYQAVRKAKRGGVVTKTALAGLQREAAKAGVTLTEAIQACCEFSWVGFRADWYAEREQQLRTRTAPAGPGEPAWRAEQRARTQQAAPGVAARNGAHADDFFIDVAAKPAATPLSLPKTPTP